MRFEQHRIQGVYTIEVEPITDDRGYLARTYCAKEFKGIGVYKHIVQMNQTLTNRRGTIRGMHYQLPPDTEIKFVRCIRGSVFDVVVDLRKGSSTFLQWTSCELSRDNMRMMLVPEGCAHGFKTLEDECELVYLHTAFYHKNSERGIRFSDPVLKIDWPLPVSEVSKRDREHPFIDAQSFEGVAL